MQGRSSHGSSRLLDNGMIVIKDDVRQKPRVRQLFAVNPQPRLRPALDEGKCRGGLLRNERDRKDLAASGVKVFGRLVSCS